MGHEKTDTGRAARASLAICGAAFLLLALASSALAAPHHSFLESASLSGFNHACGVAVDTEGDVYVASAGESKIKIFNPAHTEIGSISNANEPCALATDTNGNLYVSLKAVGKVVQYHPTAYPFAGPPSYEPPVTIDASTKAQGIAVDPTDNRLYVAEGSRISAYNSSGVLGEDEVQGVRIHADGGEFKLGFEGEETTPIPHNASHGEVQAALEALTKIGPGNVSVSGGPTSSINAEYTVTFTGALGSTNLANMSINKLTLTSTEFGVEAIVLEKVNGWSGRIGEGTLTEASGVGAYTYAGSRRYVFAADPAGTDRVYVFGGKDVRTLALKQTIDGSETPAGGFGFSPQGAYLGVDQASGHVLLYDAAHAVVDEFEATGQYFTRIVAAFADAAPTAIAVYPQWYEIQQVAISAEGGSFKLCFEGSCTGAEGSGDLSHAGGTGDTSAATGTGTTTVLGTGTGDLTEGSKEVKNFVKKTGNIIAGESISGTGVPAETTIAACSPSCTSPTGLTLSKPATSTGTGRTLTSGSKVISSVITSTGGFEAGQVITGTGIPTNTTVTITACSPSCGAPTSLTISVGVTSAGTLRALTAGSKEVKSLVTSSGAFALGQEVSGTGIPAGDTITACSPSCGGGATSLTLAARATAKGTGIALTGASKTVSNLATSSGKFLVGELISGTGIPAATTIAAVDEAAHTLTLSAAATAAGSGVSLSADLAYNLAAENGAEKAQEALEALPTIGKGNVSLSGSGSSQSPPFTVRFIGALANRNLPQMSCDGTALTGAGHSCAVSTERDGSGPGRLYVTSGAAAGAQVLAFGPVSPPSRVALPEPRTFPLAKACGTVTDDYGDIYVAGETSIKVYDPEAHLLTTISDAAKPCGLAVDSEGNLYASETGKVSLFAPSSYPPTGSTTYAAPKTVVGPYESYRPIAVNPKDDRLFVSFETRIEEYKSAKEGSALLNGHLGEGLGGGLGSFDGGVDVCAKTGDVYAAGRGINGGGTVFVLNPAGTELLATINGAGSPQGSLPRLISGIAVDQSNCHVLTSEIPNRGVIEEYEPSGAFVAQTEAAGGFPAAAFGQYTDIAVDNGTHSPNRGNAYVAFGETLYAFAPLSSPEPASFTLALTKTGSGSGTVESSPAGIACGSTCWAEFAKGAEVTLTASPSAGSEFKGWSGPDAEAAGCDKTGATLTCKVTMSEDRPVTAVFDKEPEPEKFPLTVEDIGTGFGTVTSSPGAISCATSTQPLGCAEEFEENTLVTLTAAPQAGSEFKGWSGAAAEAAGCDKTGATLTCELAMSEAKSVSAEFNEAAVIFHTLTVTVSGNGEVSADTGTISGCTSAGGSSCEGSYAQGAHVLLTETPGASSHFSGWATPQCNESTQASCEITIGSGDEAVSASFVPNTASFPLTVAIEAGEGTVVSNPGGIICTVGGSECEASFPEGELVTLTASPAAGYAFKSWKSCVREEVEPGVFTGVEGRQCKVYMSKARTIGVKFAKTWNLTAAKASGSGPGIVSSKPGGITCLPNCSTATAAFANGATVEVAAKPNKHFHLVEFKEGSGSASACNGNPTCSFTIGADSAVKALFAEDAQFALSVSKTGGGQGSVKSKPAGILCGFSCSGAAASFYTGEVVTIEVALNKGTSSLEWSSGAGTCTGSTNPCTVTMGAAHSLVAKFE